MTAKTRYFVLTAFAILIGGLTTGLVASYMGGLPVALTRGAGPDDLAFVPPDAVAVAYADVQQVMASDALQRLRRLHDADPSNTPDTERHDFEEKTGVNVERDIDAVVAAMMPGAAAGDHRPLVLARGRFDQVRIEGLAREHGGEVTDYQGVRIVAHHGDHDTMAVGFLAPGVVAVGSLEGVQAAVQAKQSGRNVLSNTEMMRLVSELDNANAWAVGRFDAVANTAGLPGELQQRVVLGGRQPQRRRQRHLQGGSQGRRGREESARHAARRDGDGEDAGRQQTGTARPGRLATARRRGQDGGGGVLAADAALRRHRAARTPEAGTPAGRGAVTPRPPTRPHGFSRRPAGADAQAGLSCVRR
jgi:hypothetical protein